MKGWDSRIEEWPQDLKDEYAYNPALARKLLADAGYPDGFKTDIVADTTGDMDLLQISKSILPISASNGNPADGIYRLDRLRTERTQARPAGTAYNCAVWAPS